MRLAGKPASLLRFEVQRFNITEVEVGDILCTRLIDREGITSFYYLCIHKEYKLIKVLVLNTNTKDCKNYIGDIEEHNIDSSDFIVLR